MLFLLWFLEGVLEKTVSLALHSNTRLLHWFKCSTLDGSPKTSHVTFRYSAEQCCPICRMCWLWLNSRVWVCACVCAVCVRVFLQTTIWRRIFSHLHTFNFASQKKPQSNCNWCSCKRAIYSPRVWTIVLGGARALVQQTNTRSKSFRHSNTPPCYTSELELLYLTPPRRFYVFYACRFRCCCCNCCCTCTSQPYFTSSRRRAFARLRLASDNNKNIAHHLECVRLTQKRTTVSAASRYLRVYT